MDIRAARQAEGASVGVQNFPASVRSLSTTASNFTSDTRAVKSTTSGGEAGDLFFETDTNWLWEWTGTAWSFVTGLYVATDAARAALTVSAADNGALFFATDTGILWKVESGSWANKFDVLDVADEYRVGGDKVLGPRGAAVAAPAGGAVIDVEARAAITALINRFKVTGGHGAIDD